MYIQCSHGFRVPIQFHHFGRIKRFICSRISRKKKAKKILAPNAASNDTKRFFSQNQQIHRKNSVLFVCKLCDDRFSTVIMRISHLNFQR